VGFRGETAVVVWEWDEVPQKLNFDFGKCSLNFDDLLNACLFQLGCYASILPYRMHYAHMCDKLFNEFFKIFHEILEKKLIDISEL